MSETEKLSGGDESFLWSRWADLKKSIGS